MAKRTKQQEPYRNIGALIVFLLIVVLIASYWQVIIACIAAIILLYILWYFRENIHRGIVSVINSICSFLAEKKQK